MDWEVFAVAEYSTDPRLIQPEPEGGIAALAADVRKESVFDYDVQVGDEDHILTLITCTDDTAVRLVVMARAAGFRRGNSRSRAHCIIR